jgi:hypothetical protein
MIAEVEENVGGAAEVYVADNGYLTEATLRETRELGRRVLVAVAREFQRPKKWPKGAETRRMHRLLRLPWAKAIYALRKTQGERPFAEIKQAMRFRQHMLRGREKTRGEWDLVTAAFNLRRLHAFALAGA